MARRLLLLFAVLSALPLVLSSLYPGKRAMSESIEICDTSDCLEIANMIMMSINTSLDPCEDFYDYACGKRLSFHTGRDFIEANLQLQLAGLLDGQPKISYPKTETEKVIMDFQVCKQSLLTEEQEFESIKKVLVEEGFGDWPLKNNHTGDKMKFRSLEDVLLQVGIDHIAEIMVGPDILGDRSAVIWIDVELPPFIEVNERKDTLHLEPRTGTHHRIKDNFGPIATEDEVDAMAKTCSHFWGGLQKKLQHRTHSEPAWKMTYKDLETRIPSFPTLKLINRLIKNSDVNVTLTKDDALLLGKPDEFEDTVEFLAEQSAQEVYNCLGLIRARTLVKLVSTAMQREAKALKKLGRLNATENELFSMLCLREVRKNAPVAFTKLYVQNGHNIRQRKMQGRLFLNKIAKEFYTHLQFLHWFDRQTRPKAIKKMWDMRPLVAFSEDLMKSDEHESLYQDIAEIHRNDSLAMIRSHLERSNKRTKFANLQQTVNSVSYIYPFEDYNAFYHPVENEIAILDGLLHSPFMKDGLPLYFPMASVGFVMAHELTHAFDLIGQVFDENGNVGRWWSNYSRDSYEDKAHCFIEEYGKYTKAPFNLLVNRRHYLRQNIADNAAIKVALTAFRANSDESTEIIPQGLENFTSDKLFFIAYAMSMCEPHPPDDKIYGIKYGYPLPNNVRVNVPLKNMEEFSAAFHCKKGSRMRVADSERCMVF